MHEIDENNSHQLKKKVFNKRQFWTFSNLFMWAVISAAYYKPTTNAMGPIKHSNALDGQTHVLTNDVNFFMLLWRALRWIQHDRN